MSESARIVFKILTVVSVLGLILVIIYGIFQNKWTQKKMLFVSWTRFKSWWFWKRYSPNLSYVISKIERFDEHGFPGFESQFTLTIANKSKPLDIDFRGVCLVISQNKKNGMIGNSGLTADNLQSKQTRTWNIGVTTPPARLGGIIRDPIDLGKPYNTGIRGIDVNYGKYKRELHLGIWNPKR